MAKDRYLVLENGMVFKGSAFGADGDVTAELVFTTAMTGYLEALTDKSYTGQALMMTFPLIGNYGVIPEDSESDGNGPCAFIVREWCDEPSNFRCGTDLDKYLAERGIVGLYGIDTRALVRILRENGTMNAKITSVPSKVSIEAIKSYSIKAPLAVCSTKEKRTVGAADSPYSVALLDFGVKTNIVRSLVKRGAKVTVLPALTSPEEIAALAPDGVLLSNGPGDPADDYNTAIIENIRRLMAMKYPTLGICLGHQLYALANGFTTEKLKYGHRGANHPVRDTRTGRVYISSQNHGYAVTPSSVSQGTASVLFENVNDKTNEGLLYRTTPALTVQFHPEACAGPHDTEFLFDDFFDLMKQLKKG